MHKNTQENKNEFLLEKEICDEIYNYRWLILFGGTQLEAFGRYADKFGDNINSGEIGNQKCIAMVYTHEDIRGGCIWISTQTELKDIVHECFHATNTALQAVGCEPSECINDEHYAYYHGWLFKHMFDCYRQVFNDDWFN